METIDLKVGKSITLKFKSLATAGYIWDFEMDRPGIVSITPEGTTQPSDTPTGQSLDEVFDIAASSPGRVKIIFRQQRSWQKDQPPHAAKEYTIDVK
jgi:predicted secreted protein